MSLTPEERAKLIESLYRTGRGVKEAITATIRQAILEEREACAKVCDDRKTSGGAGHVLIEVAQAIRSRP